MHIYVIYKSENDKGRKITFGNHQYIQLVDQPDSLTRVTH